MITKDLVIEACKNYDDPELGIDVWTLGLIYNIDIENNDVKIKLTFTSPMCPFGPQMVDGIKEEIKKKGAENVEVTVTFDPPWKPSDELREMMGV
jgi:metal-sulfur cluster biosynthetic enzyme